MGVERLLTDPVGRVQDTANRCEWTNAVRLIVLQITSSDGVLPISADTPKGYLGLSVPTPEFPYVMREFGVRAGSLMTSGPRLVRSERESFLACSRRSVAASSTPS